VSIVFAVCLAVAIGLTVIGRLTGLGLILLILAIVGAVLSSLQLFGGAQ
jgi:hypothetical protein